MHVHAVTRVHAVTPKLVICVMVRTHKVRMVNDCHIFPNSASWATVRIQTDDIHPVVVQEEWTLFSTKHRINARGC